MALRNVRLRALGKTPPFRKLAIGTWGKPGDPQIYGTLEIDLTEAVRWHRALPEGAPKITVLHMVTRAMGLAMKRYPDLNGLLRFGRIYLRESVDVACLAAVEHESGRADLTSVRVSDVDQKSVPQIAHEMATRLSRARGAKDTEVQKTSALMGLLPGFMIGFFLWLSAFISYTLNLRAPGIPKDLFGGCIITNVGSFGLDQAFAPLVPYSRAPIVLLLGEAKDRPAVVDGELVIRKIATLNATIDHRFCDGALLARMVRVIHEAFAEPEEHFGTWEPGEGAAEAPAAE